jgi:hypothetical protein
MMSKTYTLAMSHHTAAVARMLKQEGDARNWKWLMLEPVRYGDRPVEDIFPELVHASADTVRRFVVDGVS